MYLLLFSLLILETLGNNLATLGRLKADPPAGANNNGYSPCDHLMELQCNENNMCKWANESMCKCNVKTAQRIYTHGQPKSGTTWLEVILRTITAGAVKKDRSIELSADCEVINVRFKHQLPGSKWGELIDPTSSYMKTCQKCVQKGQDIWTEECVQPERSYFGVPIDERYVLILRDPRAVVVSWAHYRGQLTKNDFASRRSSDYFVDMVPKVAALTSLRYYWHAELIRRTSPSLILFYEDLISDTVNEYYRIAAFLGMNPDLNTMLQMVNASSSGSMRRQEQAHQLPGPNNPGRENAKVRSASLGGFRDEMSKEALQESTVAMFPMLHPALVAKWLLNNEDAAFLGKINA